MHLAGLLTLPSLTTPCALIGLISCVGPALRACLYMAAVAAARGSNPGIASFYRRLRSAGKPAKLALTACMRKLVVMLNAMLRTNTTW